VADRLTGVSIFEAKTEKHEKNRTTNK
jgi:hypothetical protein